jgi:hypothetical protein
MKMWLRIMRIKQYSTQPADWILWTQREGIKRKTLELNAIKNSSSWTILLSYITRVDVGLHFRNCDWRTCRTEITAWFVWQSDVYSATTRPNVSTRFDRQLCTTRAKVYIPPRYVVRTTLQRNTIYKKKKKKGKLTLKLTLQHKTIIRKHEYNIFWIGLPSFPSKRAADPRGSDSMIVFLCNATNDEPCIMDIVNKQLILPVHELIFWINTVYFKQITGCSHSQHQFSREITVHTQNIHKESSIYFHWRVYAILFPCALCVYVTRS